MLTDTGYDTPSSPTSLVQVIKENFPDGHAEDSKNVRLVLLTIMCQSVQN